jgi:chromosome segregation ATPase
MTPNTLAELMQQRIALIEKLAALNSKQLSNTQTRSGIEVELQGCLNDIGRNGESEEAQARLADLEDRLQTAANACADCDRDWQILNDELEALDRQLKAVQTGLAPGT